MDAQRRSPHPASTCHFEVLQFVDDVSSCSGVDVATVGGDHFFVDFGEECSDEPKDRMKRTRSCLVEALRQPRRIELANARTRRLGGGARRLQPEPSAGARAGLDSREPSRSYSTPSSLRAEAPKTVGMAARTSLPSSWAEAGPPTIALGRLPRINDR